MVVEKKNYYAENLGVVGEEHFQLIGSFFANDGLTRIKARLPYIGKDLASPDRLVLLEKYISRNLEFIRGGSTKQLALRFSTLWGYFQGVANEILCEEYVRVCDMSDGQALLSDRVLAQAIRGSRDPSISIAEDNLTFHYSNGFVTCPDALLLAINGENNISLQKVYEFKSLLDATDLKNIKEDSKIREVERMFESSSVPRRILLNAIGQVIELPADRILIPDPKDIPIRLVASQPGQVIGNSEYLRVRYSGGVACINFPSIRSFSYFVLKILTGAVTKHQQWRDYFTQVSPNIAQKVKWMHSN